MHDEVMQLLKCHLASVDHVDVGRYQFVNLEPVREAAGALWPQLRERAFLASRTIIERRIAEDDLIIPCATGYLVIFKALTGGPAHRLTTKIRTELETFFLGDKELADLKVAASSEKLSLSEFEEALARSQAETEPEPVRTAQGPQQAKDVLGIDMLDYMPVWDARKEAVGGFMLRARRLNKDSRSWLVNGDILRGARKPETRLALDVMVLERAVRSLESLISAGSRCALIIPAGYDSLSQPRLRSDYVTRLSTLAPALRAMIWVRLDGAPADAPLAALAETGRIIAQHAGKLFIHARSDALSLAPYAEMSPALIGTDFPTGSEAAIRTDLERFIALARRAGLETYLDNLNSWEEVRLAARSSARLLSGPSIGVFREPRAPYHLSRAGLLARAA
ncbi:hypothetical protein F1654_11955 [Alkalicaulis satelles]|uniref:Uncharacterized protein n=1 Tax=Alkalicaulis satelles TaxID=2609175 RepID=A0A5M6ZCH8_9PROT|nr:hypothetical protein [Alkalicaulis satelles]KAA5801604.1 hypothetical protein F1654_11955 [Alkalicaulis satelles]